MSARGIPTLSIRPDTSVQHLRNRFGCHCLHSSWLPPWTDIPLSAARKWDKEGRRTVPWEPHSTYHTTVFRYALGQGRKRLYPGLGECAAWINRSPTVSCTDNFQSSYIHRDTRFCITHLLAFVSQLFSKLRIIPKQLITNYDRKQRTNYHI